MTATISQVFVSDRTTYGIWITLPTSSTSVNDSLDAYHSRLYISFKDKNFWPSQPCQHQTRLGGCLIECVGNRIVNEERGSPEEWVRR
jgi:hypothetical protein